MNFQNNVLIKFTDQQQNLKFKRNWFGSLSQEDHGNEKGVFCYRIWYKERCDSRNEAMLRGKKAAI